MFAAGAMAAALMLAWPPSHAQAVEQFSLTFTDTNQDNDIDTTGIPGNYSYSANGTGLTSSGVKLLLGANIEYLNPVTPKDCPAGYVEYPYVPGGVVVLSFFTGDQLFMQIGGASYGCFNNATLTGFDVYSGTVTGGLGRYANATGTWSGTSHGEELRVDAAGHEFGSDVGTFNVRVTTPN